MSTLEKLIDKLKVLSEDTIASILDSLNSLPEENASEKPDCPRCGGNKVILYGKARKKQRFLCKCCGRTFVPTTNTIMWQSHFPAHVWKSVIADTVDTISMDYTAGHLGFSHQTAFNMRHKILMAMEELSGFNDAVLEGVSELDETFVLDCEKGRKFPDGAPRKPRKHGAKASKRGISNEYVCICTGVERGGSAYALSVNRAKPDAHELSAVFKGHISQEALALCDGLLSYNVLPEVTGCTLGDCSHISAEQKKFFNLNTVNCFHSMIKRLYKDYRGVATTYLNRYNTLFSSLFRDNGKLTDKLEKALLSPATGKLWHSRESILEDGLLLI